jgi:hypothetical protein
MSDGVRRRETRGMYVRSVCAIAVVTVAIAICLLLGTIGWVAIGFGLLTDCTNDYNCSASNCGPCVTTGLWINVGGLAQLLLAGAGVGLLIRWLRTRQSGRLARCGAVLLLSSILIVAGTTWQAQRAYCQPGSPGYADSYCSTGD